jgi:hypothetical protein
VRTLDKKNWNRIQVQEMKHRRSVKDSTGADLLRNGGNKNDLDNFPSYETITEYGDK